MTTTIARPAKDTPETQSLLRITPLMEARALQRLIYDRAARIKCSDSALASLARSWCLVQDCIRVMRGIPSPGQLRPDLDPVQLTKALKRARSRKPILDMASAGFEMPSETPEQTPAKQSPRTLGLTRKAKTPQANRNPPTTAKGETGQETEHPTNPPGTNETKESLSTDGPRGVGVGG